MLTIKKDYLIDISSRLIQLFRAEIINNFEFNIKRRVQIIYQNRIGNCLVDFIPKTHFNEILDKKQFALMD